jgi:signal transduction histidine kinase
MEVMSRELVDFSRGKTQLNLQLINVCDLLRDLEPDFAKCGQDIDIKVELIYDGALHVDRHRLLRVFGNLIRNAREAMGGNRNHVLRFVVRRVDSNVRFELSDTGCGISSELLPRIFDPFVTHGKSNGTGLGLAVSKAVVEAHQGTISARSNENGTTFQIDLPLRN